MLRHKCPDNETFARVVDERNESRTSLDEAKAQIRRQKETIAILQEGALLDALQELLDGWRKDA